MSKGTIIIIGHYLNSSKVGGPVRSVTNLVENMSKNFNFVILAPNKDFGSNKQFDNILLYEKIILNGISLYYFKIIGLFDFKFLKLIHSFDRNGNIFYLNSFFNIKQSIYIVLLKKIGFIKNAKILLCPRGELLTEILNTKRVKKIFFLKIVRLIGLYDSIYFHSTNDLEKKSIYQIFPKADEKIFVAGMIPSCNDNNNFFDNNKSSDEILKIVYLSRISRSKNLHLILDVLNNISYNVSIDIYGFVEDEDYFSNIILKSEKLPKNIRFNYLGSVDKNKVNEVLPKYDLFMLMSDGENYGHAIVESLLAGVPVLISNNTPWVKLSELGLGWEFSLQDLKAFENCINDLCNKSTNERIKIKIDVKNNAQVYFDNKEVLSQNYNMFNDLLNL